MYAGGGANQTRGVVPIYKCTLIKWPTLSPKESQNTVAKVAANLRAIAWMFHLIESLSWFPTRSSGLPPGAAGTTQKLRGTCSEER